MLTNELKCLEIMLHYLDHHDSNFDYVSQEIEEEFPNSEDFINAKKSLLNQTIINTILKHKDKPYPTNLPDFANLKNNPSKYQEFIRCLANGYYITTSNDSIRLSSSSLDLEVSTKWLYTLSESLEKNNYTHFYIYNKSKKDNIPNEQALKHYLNTSKTFIVELTTSLDNPDYSEAFTKAEQSTNSKIATQNRVKVDDIIDTFRKKLNNKYKSTISKFRLEESSFLLAKAHQIKDKFYSLPISLQKEYLNEWLLEYISGLSMSLPDTEKFILSFDQYSILGKSYDIEKAQIGLISLYIDNLYKLEGLDFYQLHLTDFKIKEYRSPSYQEEYRNNKALDNKIKRIEEAEQNLNHRSIELLELIDAEKDPVKKSKLIDEYNSTIPDIYLLGESRLKEREHQKQVFERLQKATHKSSIDNTTIDDSVLEICFDNDAIMALLEEACQNGRIYRNAYEKNRYILEIWNKELGILTFKATISPENFLLFIETTNYDLKNNIVPTKKAA